MGEYDELILPCPARVLPATLTPPADLLALAASEHAWDPEVFRSHPPFFWPAEISSNRIDSYFTRMMPSSLLNYAADLRAGISFQNSHRWRELGLGRSLNGTVQTEGELTRVIGEFYTIPGLRMNEVNTDDFILGMRAGLIHDVSIGWHGGKVLCSICGKDMFRDWQECPHIPGFEYASSYDASGKPSGDKQLAIGRVEDAHCCEVSAVYDGATPGAAVVKAQMEADAGRLEPEAARILEVRYRIKLPGCRHAYPGFGKGANMPEEIAVNTLTASTDEALPFTDQPPADAPADPKLRALVELIERLHALGMPQTDDGIEEHLWVLRYVEEGQGACAALPAELQESELPAAIDALCGRIAGLSAQVAQLAPLAADGERYRADLIADALSEGVRAYGPQFASDTYAKVLEAAPIDTIKQFRADWSAAASQLFKTGRQTIDKTAERKPLAQPGIPDAAFRS